jgi:hypothetical protein
MKANTGVHEREGYFVGLPGFDVHSQATRGMNKNMLQVDLALRSFEEELKLQVGLRSPELNRRSALFPISPFFSFSSNPVHLRTPCPRCPCAHVRPAVQGLWDSVTIVQTSEFGRTLVSNGRAGTDHGKHPRQ